MESEGQDIERGGTYRLIVVSHVVKKRVFIAEMVVSFHLRIDPPVIRLVNRLLLHGHFVPQVLEVTHFLPLGPDEIVFFEVFPRACSVSIGASMVTISAFFLAMLIRSLW
jgi:hypothetical protein